MDEIIDAVNRLATDLLQQAEALDQQLNHQHPDLDALRERLERLCGTLSQLVEYLERDPSPARRFIRALDGLGVAHSLDRLAQYLADHRSVLIRLRVPETLIEKIVGLLRDEATAGDNALDRLQTLDFAQVMEPLKALRDLVCGLARAADLVELLATPAMLRPLVTGTIGAATIVLDVTAAVGASPIDPVGWVLVKAVKSVWAGASMVKKSVNEVNGILERLRDAAARHRQAEEALRMRAQSARFQLKKKDQDGSPD